MQRKALAQRKAEYDRQVAKGREIFKHLIQPEIDHIMLSAEFGRGGHPPGQFTEKLTNRPAPVVRKRKKPYFRVFQEMKKLQKSTSLIISKFQMTRYNIYRIIGLHIFPKHANFSFYDKSKNFNIYNLKKKFFSDSSNLYCRK